MIYLYFIHLLRLTKNGFICMYVCIMQSHLRILDRSSTPICPPPQKKKKLFTGKRPRFHFIGLALTHIPTGKQNSCRGKSDQLQSSSHSCSGENQSIDEKENTILMQTELRFYGRTSRSWTEKVAYVSPFWSIACSFVVMILGCANTNVACFVGMRDDAFLFLTRSIIHYVHDRDFQTPWLLHVNHVQLCFFRCILFTFY